MDIMRVVVPPIHWRDTIPASEPSYPPVTYSAILAFVLVVALLSLLLLL